MIKRNDTAKVVVSAILTLLFLVIVFVNISSFYVSQNNSVEFKLWYLIITIVCSVLSFILGAVKFELNKKSALNLGMVTYTLAIIGSMIISILFSGGFWSSTYMFFVNTAFYLVVAAVTVVVSGNMKASAIAALVASFLFNGISFIVYCFRGWSLTPTDLAAVGTAMNVVLQYEFKMRYEIFAATALMAVLIMLVWKFPFGFKFKRKMTIRGIGVAILAVSVLFIGTVNHADYNVSVYDQHYSNLAFGSAYSFYVNAKKLGLNPSENYEPRQIDQRLGVYEQRTEDVSDVPNVVVVMNESFSDLSVVGDFETDVDYMPFLRSMQNNAIKGQMLVSPFGGYTCNSEYEFLTGMSTGVLKTHAAPYMQMLFDYMPYSLPMHMKQLGYKTLAIHPYYADSWNRNIIYDYMGFDEFVSLENFEKYSPDPEYLRRYISDKSNYDGVLNYLRSKSPDERAFVFNITMQNHGGFDDGNFASEVHLQNMNGTYPLTEQYLTLIKHADEDLKYFLERLEEFEEPIVLVVFGDHQPSVEREFYEELYGASLDSLPTEELYKRYLTPFFVWTNFDIEEQQGVKSSPCYLSNLMMEVAGLPKSRVQMYLDELKQDIVQINPMCYFDSNGTMHMHEESERLQEYYDLQYSLLTGENLSYDFYNYKNTMKLPGNDLLSPDTILKRN